MILDVLVGYLCTHPMTFSTMLFEDEIYLPC